MNSIESRMMQWLANGERGTSSETIFETISGIKATKYYLTYPADPGDFRRCHLLLELIPEWKSEMHKLKPISVAWSNLVDNWDELTDMLKKQMATKKPDGMFEFMQKLTKFK